MEVINKQYPEFGYNVRYNLNSTDKIIDWEVATEDGDILMTGRFTAKDFFMSKFTLVPSNVEENVYENLFYLYFENIKLECIELVEDKDVEDIEDFL